MTRLISWPSIVNNWFRGALLRKQTWWLELYLATNALLWGLWLVSPWRAFGIAVRDYTLLGLVPEAVWGVLFTVHGLGHVASLVIGDPRMCRRAAMALAVLWSPVLGSILLASPLSWPTPLFAMNILGCFWVYRRLTWCFA